MTDVALLAENLADYGGWLDGMSEVTAGMDAETLVVLRAKLDEARKQLAGAIAVVEARLVPLVPPGESLMVPGAGIVTVGVESKQHTRGAKLAATVAALVVDEAVGLDEPIPYGALGARIADEIVTVFGLDTPSTRFRNAEVQRRHLRLSDYIEPVDGQPKLRWQP